MTLCFEHWCSLVQISKQEHCGFLYREYAYSWVEATVNCVIHRWLEQKFTMASISLKILGYHVKVNTRGSKCLLNIYFVLSTVLGNGYIVFIPYNICLLSLAEVLTQRVEVACPRDTTNQRYLDSYLVMSDTQSHSHNLLIYKYLIHRAPLEGQNLAGSRSGSARVKGCTVYTCHLFLPSFVSASRHSMVLAHQGEVWGCVLQGPSRGILQNGLGNQV